MASGSRLTQSERSELQNLLTRKKENELRAIESKDPGWKQRVEEKKTKKAIGQLKVEKDLVEKEELEKQISILQGKLLTVNNRIDEKMPYEEDSCSRKRYGEPTRVNLCKAVEILKEALDYDVMQADDTGKKVNALNEKYLGLSATLAGCTTRDQVAESGILA